MDVPQRILPRSVLLALWLAYVPSGRGDLRRAVQLLQGDDEPHVVEGLAAEPVDLGRLLTMLGGKREIAAVLPVPGDLGVPPEVAGLAADAGEAVIVLGDDQGWALVPNVQEFGSARETGHLVTWRAVALPSGRRSLTGSLGTLAEAQQDLRATLQRAVQALDDLDVARWRPEAAEALAELRTDPGLTAVPDQVDRRVVGTLVEAVRLLRIVELAEANEGGAVNVWQADQRSTALREVGRAARRAIAAATLTASGPAPGSPRLTGT
ncbi:hypothetical protein OEB99_03350 [Actinotalea sp. M2MS4P-6]|uniref:hypothetical protein n=1 Tax=Actinotalea sp. M2MS4P-6 TaxID=2983762 RepID=UPI0021E375E7|nr:hypothetical protein [Actinotalea sp. M2MS4P-6]MCV2393334.1 hypothetical protein [Actinotalea sp. M2MS4P-6]